MNDATTTEPLSRDQESQVAQTIISQLGGRRFAVMTGAKHFMSLPSGGVCFQVGRGAKSGINCVSVKLAVDDTYTVTFRKVPRTATRDIVTVSEFSGVYCDSLQDLFTAETGLYTSL